MTFEETVKKVLEQIRKRPANHDYFFSKLDSPDWIDALAAAGLFSRAPGAIREGDTISFPFWPESQYLERMAGAAPDKVAELMLKLPETDNIRVHEDFAKAAIKLPAKPAAEWAEREARWVEKQPYLYFTLPTILGELSGRLADEGVVSTALRLARALLFPRIHDPSSNEGKIEFRFDHWHYEQILREHVPRLLHASGIDGLRVLLDAMEKASKSQGDEDGEYSWLWRPAIEPNEQNYGHGDVRNALIDAAREATAALAGAGSAADVLKELNARRAPIFKRLALHMLADRPDEPAAISEALSKSNFDDVRVWHEYSRLLGAVFAHLNDEQRAELLRWIEEGPAPAAMGELDQETIAMRRAAWQTRRLFVVREYLPPAWKQKYAQLTAALGGEPQHPEFLSFHSSWSGPRSPRSESELSLMSAAELAQFLKQWQPDGTWHSPEPEGLARVLQEVVAKAPARFVSALSLFREVEPTYARAIVLALSDAAKAKTTLDWSAVLDYLQWIVSQPRTAADPEDNGLSKDPHWGWARRATAGLLSIALQKDALPRELRQRAWNVLEPLTNDPDPSGEDDGSSMDPATLSINTPRGEALHALIQYALFVYRSEIEDTKAGQSTFDFSRMPEVGRCLERHLDPAIDRSPAIRSVYGQWIPWLMLMDEKWVKLHIESIFPKHDPLLREAAWQAYLQFCPPYEQVFLALRNQYDAAITRLGDWRQSQPGQDSAQSIARLGEHLMALAGRGLVRWGAADRMLERFFENAPIDAAAHALAFVGQSLREAHESLTPEIVQRFCELWDSLSSLLFDARRPDRRDILKAFGSWFGAPGLNADWAFDHLEAVLNGVGDVDPDYLVMESLSELAKRYPSRSVRLLRKLIARTKNKWAVLAGDESIRAILRAGLDAPESREEAVALVHELGARGYAEFRNLLVK
jgi:hypothetical protein